ncbi:MAG: oligoendopeptidase F [Treponema sp.]|nr:oligoendopeptidase F [Treponema sp.]
MNSNTIPERKDVPAGDKWDLTTIFKSDGDWEKALAKIEGDAKSVAAFQGKLAAGPQDLLAALKAYEGLWKNIELVAEYAGLLKTTDEGDEKYADMEGRSEMAISKASEMTSFFDSELSAIPDADINSWIERDDFKDYKVYVKKLLRQKEHILSQKEERILALQSESGSTAEKTFSVAENVDINNLFGTVNVDGKDLPLTQTTWTQFLENPDRSVREKAYKQFYKNFEDHQNILANLYAGSVNQDVFIARARGYKSALSAALFGNKVPESVYRNLIDTVHKNFGPLRKYYSIRKRALGLKELRHYDVYVPLVPNVDTKTSYDQAVEICREALAPLGKEYTDTLCGGLKGGWVDRYENKGKRSGAFSDGCYTGYPYILLNYKDSIIRDVFVMAHEGGHSMHSWYSAKNNPFMQYNYTIFEAEVASTFNEELVFQYLLKNAKDESMRTYLLAMRAGDIMATLHRQTMFAEYELKTHELVESGTPLSAPLLRKVYRGLLEEYFGPEMVFEDNSDMEGLRIPHFYSAFYVYKYATGISAALALAERVTKGGEAERNDYFNFLKSGGSRYPIESLRVAGVDMESPAPVQAALDKFAAIIDELDKTIK